MVSKTNPKKLYKNNYSAQVQRISGWWIFTRYSLRLLPIIVKCRVVLCYAKLIGSTLCYVTLFYVMLCYFMSCYTMVCIVILGKYFWQMFKSIHLSYKQSKCFIFAPIFTLRCARVKFDFFFDCPNFSALGRSPVKNMGPAFMFGANFMRDVLWKRFHKESVLY